MKRILALSLSAALLLALLGGCTGDNPENTNNSPNPTTGASAAVSPADTTQEPSLSLPSEEPTAEPTKDSEPTAEPTKNPEPTAEPTKTPEPTAEPTKTPEPTPEPTKAPEPTPEPTKNPEPSKDPDPTPSASAPGIPGFPGGVVIPGLPGGGGGNPDPSPSPSQPSGDIHEPTNPDKADKNVRAFAESLINGEKYEFPGMDDIETEWIEVLYHGLASIPAEQRVACSPGFGFTTAEIVLVEVTNKSDLAKVKTCLEARKQDILIQQANYLQVVDIWTFNFDIVEYENYIMMVAHKDCDAIVSDFYAYFK